MVILYTFEFDINPIALRKTRFYTILASLECSKVEASICLLIWSLGTAFWGLELLFLFLRKFVNELVKRSTC